MSDIERRERMRLLDEIERLQEELRHGDFWQRRARQALEDGTCPLCFATDEAGHTETCPWGSEERNSERLQAIVQEQNRRLTEIHSELYGHGLEVLGWHLNGDTEPLDSWFDDNEWGPVETPEKARS